MNSTSANFSLDVLEARFEMQQMMYLEDGGGEGGGGGGGSYGYYGDSWDDLGAGDGYVGEYQAASDQSGAMLDDGSYTDGTSGSFPAYTDPNDPRCPNGPDCPRAQSKCTVCRC
ncbi:MAG TPA: hypothetical protein VF527_19645 [Pyrinomonadaceae bacterium]|jgi:hypothetical protein